MTLRERNKDLQNFLIVAGGLILVISLSVAFWTAVDWYARGDLGAGDPFVYSVKMVKDVEQ